jgi:hypothetical protein
LEVTLKIETLILGTECEDRATGLKGTLTHWVLRMDGRINYVFQPKGLDHDGQPINHLILNEARLEVNDSDYVEVEVPVEILGTQVTDKASGFTGMAVDFIYHINGCFHVAIQPRGVVERTGLPINVCEFDLRRCSGEKITELSKEELTESIEKGPSPSGKGLSFDTFNPGTKIIT